MVWDHNRDGLITDNSELMSEYDKNGKAAFANGYEKLARYFDKDKNGIIEGSELNDLHFWVDDGDAVTEAGELRTPASYGNYADCNPWQCRAEEFDLYQREQKQRICGK